LRQAALKANSSESWSSGSAATLDESRGMAMVYLRGGEAGRSAAWPPAKPAPEMKQQILPGTANRITESQNGRGWKGPLWVI